MNQRKRYVGCKKLHATPTSVGEYNIIRGWDIPDDEDPNKAGYLVEYEDGGEPNLEGYAGYVSWSPKDVFDNIYKEIPEEDTK